MIGILLYTLGETGYHLTRAASAMLDDPPERLEALAVRIDANQDVVMAQLRDLVDQLDAGSGVLVLADIYGATHTNTVCKIVEPGRVAAVTGVNLPMLVRALNYRDLSLDQVVQKAAAGGKNGIAVVDRESGKREAQE
jgi:PTS system mannose-specific IIA component